MAKTVEQARADLAEAEAREAEARERAQAKAAEQALKDSRVAALQRDLDAEHSGIAHLKEKIAHREKNVARLVEAIKNEQAG